MLETAGRLNKSVQKSLRGQVTTMFYPDQPTRNEYRRRHLPGKIRAVIYCGDSEAWRARIAKESAVTSERAYQSHSASALSTLFSTR